MKKRIFSIVVCLVLALGVLFALPNQVEAATAQETGNAILEKALAMQGTLTDGCSAECPHCGKTVTWKALSTSLNAYVQDGGHYYLQGNTTQKAYQTFAQIKANICLHMNGFNFSAGYARGTFIASGRTLTIMGSGIFSSPATSGNRAVVYSNGGTVNIYGTTIKTEANNGEPALSLYSSSTKMNLWGVTLDVGTNPAITTNGTVNLYDSTVVGGTAVEHDNVDVLKDGSVNSGSTAVLNLVDSIVPGVKKEVGTVKVSGSSVINGTGLALAEGKTIDPTKLTEGASIAIASEGVFTATGKADYAQYFTSATTGLKMIAKQDGSLANLGAAEYGYEVTTQAKAMDGTFPADGRTVYKDCPACGKKNAEWVALKKAYGDTVPAGAHFYFATDLSIVKEVIKTTASTGTVCVHTNGKTNTGTRRFINSSNGAVVNVMGGGTIKSSVDGYRGTLYAYGGTINIYGTSIISTANNTSYIETYGDGALNAYNKSSTINAWEATISATLAPMITSNGTINLYNCTATGAAANIGKYAGQTSTNTKLNLYDTSIQGVNQKDGTITVSGATQITGTGLQLATGKTIDPSKLTAGAEILVADECVITGSGMGDYAKYFKAVKPGQEITVSSNGTLRCWVPKGLLVDAKGKETVSDNILADWATGNYAYIKLYGNDSLAMNGEDIVVDLAGFDLTVTGTGNISVFDTANDTYTASACGTVLNNGTVTFTETVAAPNGNRYVTVTESNRATAHRLEIKLASVSLRTTAAGLYYKAKYTCDSTLAEKVKTYGVIVSVDNMPGADYANDGEDINKYTVAQTPFQSGITATSGSIFGIMKDSRKPADNDDYAKVPIYANAYIDLGNGPIVADITNPGKKVGEDGFTGIALSLFDVMAKLDDAYNNYNTTTRLQLDNFYFQWKDKGMDWDFDYIGQTAGTTDGVDNSDIELNFDEGTTNAECPVCKKKVTWTAFQPSTATQSLQGHYYLTDDVTFTGTDASGIVYNGTKNTELCFHLNGHNMTAPKTRAFFGSDGVLNVMGNGNVTGYNNVASGAAVQTNNTVATNGVHLYGGTYKRASGTSAKAAAIATHGCGYICVYEGATIDASGAMAVLQSVPLYSRNSYVGLFGCTVNGDVVTLGSDLEKGFTSTTELVDCSVYGEVEASQSTVYISGAPKITSVNLLNESVLNTKILTDGTNIGIANNGIFTHQSESVQKYINYFHGTDAADVITVRDNALHCGPDYTSDLKFADGTTDAMCPVCSKVVTWTELTAQDAHQDLNGHYYLAEDQTFTNTGDAFFFNSKRNTTLCVHLNGHDLTATQTRVVHGSSGRTNIMGNGVVTGYQASANLGAAVQINNYVDTQSVHLYSGIYKKTSNSSADAAPLAINLVGGEMNIYEAVTVENAGGLAIIVRTPTNANTTKSKLSLHGGTVNGNIVLQGNDPSKNRAIPTAQFTDCTVNGTVQMALNSDVYLSGTPKIQLLDIEESALVTLEALKPGAEITVLNEGVFTYPSDHAQDYAGYFKAANKNDMIRVQENALRYKVDYEGKLYPDADGKAYCPVCKETVQWIAVSSGESRVVAEDGKHYYLAADILYEGEYSGNIAFFNGPSKSNTNVCLHLNDHDITSTDCHGIFGGWGVLNVMGEGVVTGHAREAKCGGAVQINNSVVGNCTKLYAGTYRNAANSVANTAVAAIWQQGSGLTIYEDADISNPVGLAVYVKDSWNRNSNLEIYGATINGNVEIAAPNGETYKAKVVLKDTTINGELTVAAGNEITLDGRTKIGKLTLAEGVVADFTNMLEGSAIAVSANGIFSTAMPLADEWLKYITCADEGDWIIVRDKQFYQESKQDIPTAGENDKTALLNAYANKEIRYGEMHNHTNSGPYRDDGTGTSYSTGADGKNSLTEWIAEMDRLEMDFAFIVDHGMSIHMYNENFRPDYFIGGTEPGTTITDSKANPKSPHYNMLFADPEKLESIFFKWETKYKPVKWNLTNYPNALTPSEDGYRIKYPTFTTAEFGQLAKDVYDAGGLLVHVHPKYDSYIYSNDPMDYFFADYSGFEITTGSGGNMMYKDNDEAYETWVDLLEMGKKIWATAGSDRHRLPDISGMTVMYTKTDNSADYMETVRAGNMAPGWIGIRMNVNGTEMGGESAFTGNRLQFSVGDIYNTGKKDYVETPNPYVAGHTYRVELYDDGGLLMTTNIDPTQMNYFAIDCDETAKFYRVVVWDETDNERIGVSNPIWNTEPVEE